MSYVSKVEHEKIKLKVQTTTKWLTFKPENGNGSVLERSAIRQAGCDTERDGWGPDMD